MMFATKTERPDKINRGHGENEKTGDKGIRMDSRSYEKIDFRKKETR